MKKEEAIECAKKMTYQEAIRNTMYAKGVRYKKATRIKLQELAEIADILEKGKNMESTENKELTVTITLDEYRGLISRADAIDRLKALHKEVEEVCADDYDRGTMHGLAWATDILKVLPSADRPQVNSAKEKSIERFLTLLTINALEEVQNE